MGWESLDIVTISTSAGNIEGKPRHPNWQGVRAFASPKTSSSKSEKIRQARSIASRRVVFLYSQDPQRTLAIGAELERWTVDAPITRMPDGTKRAGTVTMRLSTRSSIEFVHHRADPAQVRSVTAPEQTACGQPHEAQLVLTDLGEAP